MSKRRNQRRHGARKARLALFFREQAREKPQAWQELLEEMRACQPPPDWRNPWDCPLCRERRTTAAFFDNERCEACREDAYLLEELFCVVFGLPWTDNDYGLPLFARQAIQIGGKL